MFVTLYNFPQDTLDNIRGVLTKFDFPWRFCDFVSSPGDPGVKFAKAIYRDTKECQDVPEEYRDIAREFPKWLGTNSICDDTLSLRFNMTMKHNVPLHEPHVDHGNPYLMTAILYCSDTNGGTLFYDGDNVIRSEGRKGSVAIFKSNTPHRVEGHTEGETGRVILNCIFLPTPEFMAKFEAGEL